MVWQGYESQLQVRIFETDPLAGFAANSDVDNDGVLDSVEGLADDDGDRVPNFIERLDETNQLLPIDTAESRFVTSEPGVGLRLGNISFASAIAGSTTETGFNAAVAPQAQNASGTELIPADTVPHVGDIVDFEVIDLPTAGQQINVVIPLSTAIPNNAIYRKYLPIPLTGFGRSGWVSFDNTTVNANGATDALASTMSIGVNACPDYDDASWQSGLVAGNNCLRLTLTDGGPNDADNAVNGQIADPGVLSGQTAALATSSLTLGAQRLDANGRAVTAVTVRVADVGGNPMSGVTVTLSQSGSAVTLSALTDNNDGSYAGQLTAGTQVGNVMVTARVDDGSNNAFNLPTAQLELLSVQAPVASINGGASGGGGGSTTLIEVLLLLSIVLLWFNRSCIRFNKRSGAILLMLPLLTYVGLTQAQTLTETRVEAKADAKLPAWYLGVGINFSELEPRVEGSIFDSTDTSDTGYQLLAGYRLLPYLSAELGYADLGASSLDFIAGANNGMRAGEIDYTESTLSLVYYPFSNEGDDMASIQPYIQVGVRVAENSFRQTMADASRDVIEDTDTAEYWGLGFEGRVDQHSAIRFGYTRYSEDADSFQLSYIYSFGGQSKKGSAKKAKVAKPVVAETPPAQEPAPAPAPPVPNLLCSSEDAAQEAGSSSGCTPEPAVVAQPVDSDKDGVDDASDLCPHSSQGAKVANNGCAALPTIYFANDSSDLGTEALTQLSAVLNRLNRNPKLKLNVVGHASKDRVKDSNYNQRLAKARAEAAALYLLESNINSMRLNIISEGYDKPASHNRDELGWKHNRRVTFSAAE